MKITSLAQTGQRERTVAVGEFDGVHLGHREVINGSDTVLTFDPHPRAVVGEQGAPDLLTTIEQRADQIERLGVSELVVIHFDEEFSKMGADEFVESILVEKLGATRVSVGANFRFGSRAAGDPDTLRGDSRFQTRVVDLVSGDDGPVSSSRIRDLLRTGDIARATRLLGHRHEIRGKVIAGAKRGRELGYPTANLRLTDGCVVPAHGIYACTANGRKAVASLGVRPTFEDQGELLLEVHLLDFEGDLYGTELKVELVEHLREELEFADADQLIAQMDDDAKRARAALISHDQ